MKKTKLNKLVLRKETIVNLSEFEQSRILGGDITDYIAKYTTYMESRKEAANCALGYGNTDFSYCYCTQGKQTCNTCNQPTCKAETCNQGVLPGQCGYTADYEICRTQ